MLPLLRLSSAELLYESFIVQHLEVSVSSSTTSYSSVRDCRGCTYAILESSGTKIHWTSGSWNHAPSGHPRHVPHTLGHSKPRAARRPRAATQPRQLPRCRCLALHLSKGRKGFYLDIVHMASTLGRVAKAFCSVLCVWVLGALRLRFGECSTVFFG